uniref:Uncharacterized protein n=1 Tax=Arundo donax TaxID=35708 RepID=A0A0A9BPI7_ARUDO
MPPPPAAGVARPRARRRRWGRPDQRPPRGPAPLGARPASDAPARLRTPASSPASGAPSGPTFPSSFSTASTSPPTTPRSPRSPAPR